MESRCWLWSFDKCKRNSFRAIWLFVCLSGPESTQHTESTKFSVLLFFLFLLSFRFLFIGFRVTFFLIATKHELNFSSRFSVCCKLHETLRLSFAGGFAFLWNFVSSVFLAHFCCLSTVVRVPIKCFCFYHFMLIHENIQISTNHKNNKKLWIRFWKFPSENRLVYSILSKFLILIVFCPQKTFYYAQCSTFFRTSKFYLNDESIAARATTTTRPPIGIDEQKKMKNPKIINKFGSRCSIHHWSGRRIR